MNSTSPISSNDQVLVDEVDLGPGVRAGFTSRRGGASKPPWHGLNLGDHVHDDPAAVADNRAAVESWLAVPIAFSHQVHGAEVALVAGLLPPNPIGDYDAMVTADPGIGLGILVADCVPLLLADPIARVVAVAHAGRAGLVGGVVEAVVEAMLGLGGKPGQILAAVGPAIAGRSYEVPLAMQDDVERVVPGTACVTDRGTPGVDVPLGVLQILRRLGVNAVTMVARDTFQDPDFFSYRRDGPVTGRFAGVIRLL